MVKAKRKHTNLISIVFPERRPCYWEHWRGLFPSLNMYFLNLQWVHLHHLVIKRAGGEISLNYARDQQNDLREGTPPTWTPIHYCLNGKKRYEWLFSVLNFANIPAEGYGDLGPSVFCWQDLVSIPLTQNSLHAQAHSMCTMFTAAHNQDEAVPHSILRLLLPLSRASSGLLTGKGSYLSLQQGCPQSKLLSMVSLLWGPEASPRSSHLNWH